MNQFIKAFFWAAVFFFLFKLAKLKFTIIRLEKQGVYFLSKFPIITDSIKMLYYISTDQS
jgi:hypothetical protein